MSPLLEQAGAYGSVVFRFTSPYARNLYAAVMIHEVGQPIGYHVDAFGTDDEDNAATREGVWWLPRPSVKDNLIISNASDKPNRARLFLYDATGRAWHQDIPLGPRQTLRLVVGDLVKTAGLTGTYGGIMFQIAKRSGSVDTVHIVYDETSRFSALMKMFDHDPSVKLEERAFLGNSAWTTWAPMLALQNPDPALALPKDAQLRPQVLIRNTTLRPQAANIKFTWRSDSNKGVVPLATIQLHSFETRLIDVAALQQKGQIPADAHWALVEISSPTAKPDDIMAVACSYDSTGRYGAQTPFSDQLADHWVAGEFQVDATHNSLMAVTNVGKKPADTQITFHYNHGQDHYEVRKSIAPGDQLWLNLDDLIRGSVPDTKGTTFPTDLTYGTYDIHQVKGASNPSIFEGKIIVDKTNGHLAYGCVSCCGYQAVAYAPNPFTGAVGGGTNNSILAEMTCNNGWDDVTYGATNWTSDNPPVAQVANAHTSLQSPGTANGSGTVCIPWGNRLNSCPNSCRTLQGGINSLPTITQDKQLWYFGGQASPPTFSQGSTTITLTANGSSQGTFAWSLTNGNGSAAAPFGNGSTSQTSSNNNTVSLTSTGPSLTGTDTVLISLTYTTPTGQVLPNVNYLLNIESPASLTKYANDQMYGADYCPSEGLPPSGSNGWALLLHYSVRSKLTGAAIANEYVNETFDSRSNIASNNWPSPTAASITTAGTDGSQFIDQLCAASTSLSPPTTIPFQGPNVQVLNIHQIWRSGSMTNGAGLPVQYDILYYYTNQGAVQITTH